MRVMTSSPKASMSPSIVCNADVVDGDFCADSRRDILPEARDAQRHAGQVSKRHMYIAFSFPQLGLPCVCIRDFARIGAFLFIVMSQVFGALGAVELFINERASFL